MSKLILKLLRYQVFKSSSCLVNFEMNNSKKRKIDENRSSLSSHIKRSRRTEPLPSSTTLFHQSFFDEKYKIAKEKEREFHDLNKDFVVPITVPFLECIDVLTEFHYWLKVNREVLVCAFDIFYRYLAKCHTAISDYNKVIRVLSACTLLAEKFCGGDEGELDIRDKILEKTNLDKKELAEAERQVLNGIDYRINFWNCSYFIDYFAKLCNYGQESKEVSFAYLVFIAAQHSRKLQHAKHSLNAAASLAVATEILAHSGSRGPLKRKRSDVKIFNASKVLASSKEELAICKRTILKAMRRCKQSNVKVYRVLSRECGRADPVEVLEQLNKKQRV